VSRENGGFRQECHRKDEPANFAEERASKQESLQVKVQSDGNMKYESPYGEHPPRSELILRRLRGNRDAAPLKHCCCTEQSGHQERNRSGLANVLSFGLQAPTFEIPTQGGLSYYSD
jgi:hypothetical protein